MQLHMVIDLQSVAILNPWWQSPEALTQDPHLVAIAGKPYYFDNPLKRELTMKPNHLAILRGSRQVGKTTLLKEKICEAISTSTLPPDACLYLTCEGFADFRELQHLLVQWLQSRATQPALLCLDEITFVEQWQRAILWLINAGLTQHATVLITGSNARDLKQSGERFPGRHVKEYKIYPLSLPDYRTLACFAEHSFQELLTIYLQVGGFPHAIRDYCQHGHVTDDTYETYANWIFGDAHRFRLQRDILLHILLRLCETVGSRITWQKLIEDSPIQSHETAASYIEHLEDAFLTVVLRCYDPEKHLGAPRKARKAYVIDPLLYPLAKGYLQGLRNVFTWWQQQLQRDDFKGALFESIVVNHWARQSPQTYFWYSANLGREVDLLLPGPDTFRLFEIKSKPITIPRTLGKDVCVITPDTLEPLLRTL